MVGGTLRSVNFSAHPRMPHRLPHRLPIAPRFLALAATVVLWASAIPPPASALTDSASRGCPSFVWPSRPPPWRSWRRSSGSARPSAAISR